LLAGAFGGAFAITEFISPGTTGAEALILSAVVVGLMGGFLIARINPHYGLPAALYAASFAGLLYLSLRAFWLAAPITLASSGFLLIIPCALLGAYTAVKLAARHQSKR